VNKLSNLCNFIGSGLVISRYKSRLGEKPIKEYKVITIKSTEVDSIYNEELFEKFPAKRVIPDKYIIKSGDIVIRNSAPFTATFFKEVADYNWIVPSQFTIIRADSNSISANYLAIVLNCRETKRYFEKETLHSTMPIIKLNTLKELDVIIQSSKKQENIIKINNLLTKEMVILKQIIEEKKEFDSLTISELIGDKND